MGTMVEKEGLFISADDAGLYYHDVQSGKTFEQKSYGFHGLYGVGGLKVLGGRYFIWDDKWHFDTGVFREPEGGGQMLYDYVSYDLTLGAAANHSLGLTYMNDVFYLNNKFFMIGDGFAVSEDGLEWETYEQGYTDFVDMRLGEVHGTIFDTRGTHYSLLRQDGYVIYYDLNTYEYRTETKIDFGWVPEFTETMVESYKNLGGYSGVGIIGNTAEDVFYAYWDGNASPNTWGGELMHAPGPYDERVGNDYYLYREKQMVCSSISNLLYSNCDTFAAGNRFHYTYLNDTPEQSKYVGCHDEQENTEHLIEIPFKDDSTSNVILHGVTYRGDSDYTFQNSYYVKKDGVWKPGTAIYFKENGVWKQGDVKIKTGDAWR